MGKFYILIIANIIFLLEIFLFKLILVLRGLNLKNFKK